MLYAADGFWWLSAEVACDGRPYAGSVQRQHHFLKVSCRRKALSIQPNLRNVKVYQVGRRRTDLVDDQFHPCTGANLRRCSRHSISSCMDRR